MPASGVSTGDRGCWSHAGPDLSCAEPGQHAAQVALDAIGRKVAHPPTLTLEHAFANPADSRAYVAAHAQDMSEEVMYKHIDLYVNEYSIDLGAEGRGAVRLLFDRAASISVIPAAPSSLFLD